MEYPRPAPWVCSGYVTWDKSSSLTSVAEHTFLTVPAPGQWGRKPKGHEPPPCHIGQQEGGSYPKEMYTCLLLILRLLLPDGWAGPILRPQEGQKAAPAYTVAEPHKNSHLVLVLLAQSPLTSPPTSFCPCLFHLHQIQEAPGLVLPAVFGTTSAFSYGERTGTGEDDQSRKVQAGTTLPPKPQ